jgi:hypothetical protein
VVEIRLLILTQTEETARDLPWDWFSDMDKCSIYIALHL